jgi:DegV family protein with EDD domain
MTLSGGERLQVISAAVAAKAGWTMHAIQERLAKIREKTEIIYTLDTLDYLMRGGRIGRVKAMAGALLHLKPVIRVDMDGKYSTVTTARTIGKGMSAITEHLYHIVCQCRRKRSIAPCRWQAPRRSAQSRPR